MSLNRIRVQRTPRRWVWGLIFILFTVEAIAELPAAHQAELEHMLRHDCGSCHGMTLKGGLGPALTEEALRGKPREYLDWTIRNGHPGTPMPPWEGILTTEEINYLIELLMNQTSKS